MTLQKPSRSEALGKEIKYVRVPYEATKQGMMAAGVPEWQAEGFIEQLMIIDASTRKECDAAVFKQITGEEPTDLKN